MNRQFDHEVNTERVSPNELARADGLPQPAVTNRAAATPTKVMGSRRRARRP